MYPPVPKYTKIWDISKVLHRLEQWSPEKYLSLKLLTCKVALLILLASGQRVQTLHALDITLMDFSKNQVVFQFDKHLKHSRPGKVLEPLVLRRFPDNPKLCVLNYLGKYLKRTGTLRSTDSLFISLNKPHGSVSKSTISRWVKYGLAKSGINLQVYGPHSIRAASTSAAISEGVSVETIMQKGSWSNSQTFYKWYHKPIDNSSSHKDFQKSVMSRKH